MYTVTFTLRLRGERHSSDKEERVGGRGRVLLTQQQCEPPLLRDGSGHDPAEGFLAVERKRFCPNKEGGKCGIRGQQGSVYISEAFLFWRGIGVWA